MERYIKISFEGKSYKMNLTKELEQALFFHLQEKYLFDDKGFLIRSSNNIEDSNFINKQILEALIDVLAKYTLDDEYLDYLDYLKNSNIKLDDLVANKFFKTSVDELIIIYNNEVVHKSKKNTSKKEEIKETTVVASPQIPWGDELSKKITFSDTNAYKNKELAYQVLLRASKQDDFKNFITEDKIKEAIAKIVICENQEEFEKKYIELSKPESGKEKEDIKQRLIGLMAFNSSVDGNTYIKENCRVEVIVHELNHFLSINKKEPGLELITRKLLPNDIEKRLNIRFQGSTNEDIKNAYSEALNEAVTLYITRKMLPELNVTDAYNYGATFLDSYIKACEGHEKNIEQELLSSYYKGNKNSLSYIINHINGVEKDYFFKILDSMFIDQCIHMQLLPIKYAKVLQTKEDITKFLNKIRKEIELKMSTSGHLEEFYKLREEYSKEERNFIKEIQESKTNDNKKRG